MLAWDDLKSILDEFEQAVDLVIRISCGSD
jgi:hypothetical protein